MEASENQRTSKMRGGYLHEVIKEWEHRVDVMLGDVAVHEEPEALESHTEYPTAEDELIAGHKVMSGAELAIEAYNALGTDPAYDL